MLVILRTFFIYISITIVSLWVKNASAKTAFDVYPVQRVFSDEVVFKTTCVVKNKSFAIKPAVYGVTIIDASESGWRNLQKLDEVHLNVIGGLNGKKEIYFEVLNLKTNEKIYTAKHYIWPASILNEMMLQINKNVLSTE